jgi:hypothetical protein
MRLVVSLFTAVCFIAAAPRGQRNWRCYTSVSGYAFGAEAQHHRHHQAAVATS